MKKTYNLDSTVKLIIKVFIIVSIFLLIKYLSPVLLPFVIGWFIAYLIYPIVSFVQYNMRVKSRIVSIVIVLLLLLTILFGFGFLFIPMVYKEVVRVMPVAIEYFQTIGKYPFISDLLYKWQEFFSELKYQELLNIQSIETIMNKVLPGFWGVVSSAWAVVLFILVIFMVGLYLIFILKDYEKLNKGLVEIVPREYRRLAIEIKNDLSKSMNQYFRGQFLISLIVAILYCIGYSIIGLPMAIPMGLLIGMLHIVPYLQTIGFVPVVFFAFLGSLDSNTSFGMLLLGVLIVFLIIQTFNDVFLVPKIMGNNLGLKPAIILLSLSIFGATFGMIGLIIALPMTTVVLSYYKRFIINKESVVNEDY